MVTPLGVPSISITFDCFEDDALTLGRAIALLLVAGNGRDVDFDGEAVGAVLLAFSLDVLLTRSTFLDGFLFEAGFGDRFAATGILRLVSVLVAPIFLGFVMRILTLCSSSGGATTAMARQYDWRERA